MERERRFPIGASVSLDELSRDPYPIFDRLRAAEPVTWLPALGMWLVTQRADAVAVLSDAATFRNDSPRSTIREAFGPQMLSADGVAHAHYKRQCFSTFRPAPLEVRMPQRIRHLAEGLLDVFDVRVELRTAFANPLAIAVISEVVGIGQEFQEELRSGYERLSAALANFQGDAAIRAEGQAAAESIRGILRRCPGTQGSLLAALQNGGRLSQEEILSNCLVVLFGGIETTESALLNAVWALANHPEEARLALSHPGTFANAMEETLRWEPAVQSCTRHAARETCLRGVAIEEGETVQCMVGAANRDPAHFAAPERFDVRRENAVDHLTLGFGRHFCLGAALARLTLREGVTALLQRFPAYQLADRCQKPQGYEFRKPPALEIDLPRTEP